MLGQGFEEERPCARGAADLRVVLATNPFQVCRACSIGAGIEDGVPLDIAKVLAGGKGCCFASVASIERARAPGSTFPVVVFFLLAGTSISGCVSGLQDRAGVSDPSCDPGVCLEHGVDQRQFRGGVGQDQMVALGPGDDLPRNGEKPIAPAFDVPRPSVSHAWR